MAYVVSTIKYCTFVPNSNTCRISLSVLGWKIIHALMQYHSYRYPCNNWQSCVFPAVLYWSTSKFITLYYIRLDSVKKLTANPSVLMYNSRNNDFNTDCEPQGLIPTPEEEEELRLMNVPLFNSTPDELDLGNNKTNGSYRQHILI